MDINDRISQYRQDIKSDRVDMSFGEIINMYKDEEIIIHQNTSGPSVGTNSGKLILLSPFY